MTTLPLWRYFRILANELRLDILLLLDQQVRPLCVKEVAQQLEISEVAASIHLRLLASAGVLNATCRGKFVFYNLPRNNVLLVDVLELSRVSRDQVIFTVTGLTHERRILILRRLAKGPGTIVEVATGICASEMAVRRQMDKLERRLFVKRNHCRYELGVPDNSLGRKILRMVLETNTPSKVC